MDPHGTMVEQQQEEITRLREELRRIKQQGSPRTAPPPPAANTTAATSSFSSSSSSAAAAAGATPQRHSMLPRHMGHGDDIYINDPSDYEALSDSRETAVPSEIAVPAAPSVSDLEEEIEAHRLQLQSKNETIALVQEALDAARETSEALQQELGVLQASVQGQRRQQAESSRRQRQSPEQDEARQHLKRLVEEAVSARRQAEAQTAEVQSSLRGVEESFAAKRDRLKVEVEAARQQARQREAQRQCAEAPSAADSVSYSVSMFDTSEFQERLAHEKRDMLMSLEDEKQRLLDEFHVMRSRLRAKIALLEKNGENRQRQLEELHVGKGELETKLMQVRDNHKRLFDQFKGRLDTQHGQLMRAKAREAKTRKQLDERGTECEDLKMRLHASLGSNSAAQYRPTGRALPQRRDKQPFR